MFCPDGFIPFVSYMRQIPQDIVSMFEHMSIENGGTSVEKFVFDKSCEQFAFASPDLKIAIIDPHMIGTLYVGKDVILERRKLCALRSGGEVFPSRSPDPVHIMRVSDDTVDMVAACDLDDVDGVLEEDYYDNFYTDVPLIFSRGTGVVDLSLLRWLEAVDGDFFSDYAAIKTLAAPFEGWCICIRDTPDRRAAREAMWQSFRISYGRDFQPDTEDCDLDAAWEQDDPGAEVDTDDAQHEKLKLADDRNEILRRGRQAAGAPRRLREEIVSVILNLYPDGKPGGHGDKKRAHSLVCERMTAKFSADTFSRAWSEAWPEG